MATPTRIYMITKRHRQETVHQLVRAANAAQARSHVARNSYAVAVASQDDLVEQLGFGVKVETANEEEAAE